METFTYEMAAQALRLTEEAYPYIHDYVVSKLREWDGDETERGR